MAKVKDQKETSTSHHQAHLNAERKEPHGSTQFIPPPVVHDTEIAGTDESRQNKGACENDSANGELTFQFPSTPKQIFEYCVREDHRFRERFRDAPQAGPTKVKKSVGPVSQIMVPTTPEDIIEFCVNGARWLDMNR
jgi:hypothetical protein